MKIKIQQVLLGCWLVLLLTGCASLDKAESLYREGEKEKALEMAAKFLKSDESAERLRAVELIGKIGGQKAGELLVPVMDDPQPEVQRAAIKNIGNLSYAPAAEKLVALVPEAKGETLDEVSKAIRKIGKPATDLLVELFNDRDQQHNRDKVKKVIIDVGPVMTDSMVNSLKGKSYFENRDNYDILIALKNPRVAHLMIPFIADEEVAHLVVEGLGRLGSLAVDAVMEALQEQNKKNGEPLVRERLVKVLGELKDPRAMPLLESMSQDGSELVRMAVDRALFKIRNF